jgi:limonene-1,2-epoxide hydrolase
MSSSQPRMNGFLVRVGLWPCAVLLLLVTATAPAVHAGETAEPDEVKLVRELIRAYERMDWNAVADSFTEQGSLHSVMRDPVTGREVIRERLVKFHHGVQSLQLEVLHIGKVGDVVIVERMDHWVMNDRPRKLPAVGVLSFENGKVSLWKEYYDLNSLKLRMDPNYPGDL